MTNGTGRWLVVERRIRGISPPDLLRWWTDAALLTRWWPEQADVDAREGGRLHLAWPAPGWHLRGEITEYRPAERLAFSWAWDHAPDEPPREVRVEARADGDDTTLTITHGPYGPGPSEEEVRQGHLDGWNHFLGRLEAALRG